MGGGRFGRLQDMSHQRLNGPARSIQLAKMSYEKLGLKVPVPAIERFGGFCRQAQDA